MTPQKFILPQLLKIAKMVWDAAALWWEEWAVPWLRTSFREGMIPASSLSYLSNSIHPLSVQLNQFGWWFMKEWKALASVCKILRSPSIVWVCFQVKLQRNKYIDPQTGYIQASVQRVVISPPELGWVPHYGYCSLFPMLMHLLPLVMNWPFFIQVMIGSIFLSFFFFESLALLLLPFYSRRKKRVPTAVVCLWCKEDGFWVFVLAGLASFWKSVGSSSEWDSFVDKFWTTISLDIKVEE